MKRFGIASLGLVLCASSASAGITAFNFNAVDNSAGSPALDGFSTTDVTIDFDSRWTGSQLLIVLEQGSIYQHPLVNGNGPPSSAIQGFDAAATYDSYVTLNARSAEELQANLLAFGGAVDLGGSPFIEFDEAGVNAAWTYLPPPPPVDDAFWANFQDKEDFLVSRISLSDDAVGTFTVLASAGGIISTTDFNSVAAVFAAAATDPNAPLLVEGEIVDGLFVVPEPATAGLLTLGLLAVRRRRD